MKPTRGDVDSPNKKKSEVVTVRLDPRLKYLAEIAARKQRRTLSGYIEWAVEQSLKQVLLHEGDGYNGNDNITVADAQNNIVLWDVDEAERVTKLAFHFPELLSYEEQLIWRLVRDCGYVWKGSYNNPDKEWMWTINENKIIWDRLREHWDSFKQVADGNMTKDKLPSWIKKEPSKIVSSWEPPPDLDEEIPF